MDKVKIIGILVLLVALAFILIPGLGKKSIPLTVVPGTPTSYEVQSNISCSAVNICTDYLTANAAPSTITTKCTDSKCVFITPKNPDAVQGGVQ